MSTKELIEQAIALPVEERALVMDSLLRSLNPSQSDIDAQWKAEAKHRLAELCSGKVESVAGETVFDRVWDRFKRSTACKPVKPQIPNGSNEPEIDRIAANFRRLR